MRAILFILILTVGIAVQAQQRLTPVYVANLETNGRFDVQGSDGSPSGWGYLGVDGNGIVCSPPSICEYVFNAGSIKQTLTQTIDLQPGQVPANDLIYLELESRAESFSGAAAVKLLITYADSSVERFKVTVPAAGRSVLATLRIHLLKEVRRVKVKVIARVGAGRLYLDTLQVIHTKIE